MPKPSDLHTHLASTLSYYDFLENLEINNKNKYQNLQFGYEEF